MPDTPHFQGALAKVQDLAAKGLGDVIVLSTAAAGAPGQESVANAFRSLRREEWKEFSADCGKFEVEIAKEIRIEKFTLAELEEEEQSLERLRRWHRDLKSRDVLELAEATAAEEHLRGCVARLEEYADMVYARLHNDGSPDGPGTTDLGRG